MSCTKNSAVLAALTLGAAHAPAQVGSVYVDAKSNIFGYGVGTPQPGGGGGGLVAPSFALAPGATSVTLTATGRAGWGGALVNGPDGGSFSGHTGIPAVGPISGFSAPLSGHLVGLFIPSGSLAGLSAPAALGYPNAASFTQASYTPGLRQVFFIGDGRRGTGAGAVQAFFVPPGAARLVLGIADAYGFNASAGYYNDNVGGYNVNYQAVPEPATMAVFGIGIVGLLRRRRS